MAMSGQCTSVAPASAFLNGSNAQAGPGEAGRMRSRARTPGRERVDLRALHSASVACLPSCCQTGLGLPYPTYLIAYPILSRWTCAPQRVSRLPAPALPSCAAQPAARSWHNCQQASTRGCAPGTAPPRARTPLGARPPAGAWPRAGGARRRYPGSRDSTCWGWERLCQMCKTWNRTNSLAAGRAPLHSMQPPGQITLYAKCGGAVPGAPHGPARTPATCRGPPRRTSRARR